MAKIKVRPLREKVPPHPIDGVLKPDGGNWTADQYTFRLIRDGVIEQVKDEPEPDPPQQTEQPEHQPAAAQAEGATHEEAPPHKRKR